MLIEEVGASIRARGPGERRNRVDDQFESAFACGQRVSDLLALVDVRQQHAPTKDVATGVAKWKPVVLKPAICAVRSPQPLRDLVWTARADRLREDLNNVR